MGSAFDHGELAYLALTSKAESAIRDRLAWTLTKSGKLVAREWRERCDLAVLDPDGDPIVVLEAKATYTHDTSWSMGREKLRALQQSVGGKTALDALIRSDAAKAIRVAGNGSGYLLLIAMHRHDPVRGELFEVISEGHRPPRDQRAAHRELLDYLKPLGAVGGGVPLGHGRAFGIRMTVSAWLCGPIRPVASWAPARGARSRARTV